MGKRNMRDVAQGFLSGNGKEVEVDTQTAVETAAEVNVVAAPVVAVQAVEEIPKTEAITKAVPAEEPVQEVQAVEEKTASKKATDSKMVGYSFLIPWALKKRFNRVMDEMTENGVKMNKKDFIVMAVEKLISEYEVKYGLK